MVRTALARFSFRIWCELDFYKANNISFLWHLMLITRTLAPQTLDDAGEENVWGASVLFSNFITSWQWHPWVHGLFRNKRRSHKTWNWIVTSVHKLKRCFCVGQDGQSSATGYFQYLCLLSRLRLLTCRIFFVFISSTPILLYVLPLLWFYFCIYLFKPLLCCIFYW